MATKDGKWKMEAPCADCPFSDSVAGIHLRKSLRPGRIAEIKRGLKAGEYFTCHKTSTETGNGTKLICAGALDWQHERGLSSNYERVCESLDYFRARRSAIASPVSLAVVTEDDSTG